MKIIVKRILSFLLIFVLISSTLSISNMITIAYETPLSAMQSRAEALVNYEWIPQHDIAVWNENPYNGSMLFKAGEPVKGIPYTLFSRELGFDSLLSLAQYKTIINYSVTNKCNAVGNVRTGPAYGSCCATFISEIFGGSFMSGKNPKYDGVGSIQNNPYVTTYENIPAYLIEPGDAVSSSDGSHVIWIGDIIDENFVVYEETPPVARKIEIPRNQVDQNGFLTINYFDKDLTFNVVTKNNEYVNSTNTIEQITVNSTNATITESDVVYKLNSLINTYPAGSKWTSTFDGGAECYGFAKLIVYNIFGKYNSSRYRSWLYDGTSTSGMNIIGSITSFSSSNVKNLLSNAKPGDVLQFNTTTQHSMIVWSVDSDGFTVYDCNAKGKNDYCRVRREKLSFGSFSSWNSSKLSLLRADNYSGSVITHTKDSNYNTNYTAYLKEPNKNHYCFESSHGSNNHYVNGSDPCTIIEVYTDGCCKFTYATDSGSKITTYGKISWFYTNSGISVDSSYGTNFTAYLKAPSTNHYCYNADRSSNTHYVNGTDPCTIHEVYTDGYCKFSYLTDSYQTVTTYGKISWFSWNTHTINSNYPKNFTAYLNNPSSNHYVFNENHSNTGGYINDIDPVTIYEVYTDGCCKLQYVTSAGVYKQAYGKIDWFKHTHSYTEYFEEAHPHKVYKKCYCGDSYYTGGTRSLSTCEICNPAKYSIKYNANGGSGAPSEQTKIHNVVLILSTTIPSKNVVVSFNANGGNVTPSSKAVASVFNGWNSKLDGTGAGYGSGDEYSNNTAITLYAQWALGTTTLPAPTRTGYTFGGWYSDSALTTKVGNGGDSYTPTAAITLYAKWTANTYTVSYNANGATSGTAPANQTKTHGTALTLAKNTGSLAKTGYALDGWATSPNGAKAYNLGGSYTANADTPLYAHWIPYKVPVIYRDPQQDTLTTVSPTYTAVSNQTAGTLKWSRTTDGVFTISGSTTASQNITGIQLPATAAGEVYKVTITKIGGSLTGGNIIAELSEDGENRLQGLIQDGQSISADRQRTQISTGDSSNSFWAIYKTKNNIIPRYIYLWVYCPSNSTVTAENYQFKITVQKVSGATSKIVTYDTALGTLPAPTRTGYDLKGWFTSSSSGTQVNESTVFTKTSVTSYFAQWTPHTYSVKFNGNGSTSGSMSNQSFTYDVAQNLTANAFKRAYTVNYNYNGATGGNSTASATATATFNGWATSASGAKVYNDKQSVKNLATSGTYNLYANWTLGTVTLPTPTKTGYTFAGWYTDEALTTSAGAAGTSYKPTANVTLYAKWTTNTYTVKFNGNGSTSGSMSNQSFTYDVAQNLTANAFKRAYKVTFNYNGSGASSTTATATYTFANWNKKADGSSTSYTDQQSVKNLTSTDGATVNLYAQWTSASVKLPSPTRAGYTFGGWYKEAACTTKVGNGGDSYTPTAAITLYAKWTKNSYTISYTLNGGTVSTTNPSSYNVDTASFTLNNPTKTGYTFTGWTGSNGTTPQETVTIAQGSTGNKTYTANWTPITYSVKFNGNGATSGSMSNQSFTYGVSQNLTANAFERKYTVTYNYNGSGASNTTATVTYKFSNWNKKADGSSTSYTDGQSVNNLTSTDGATFNLYAQWNGSSAMLPTPTRTGYIFNGWNTKADGTGTSYAAGTSYTPTADVTLYATWTDNQKPTAVFSISNDVADHQTINCTMSDNVGLAGYAFALQGAVNYRRLSDNPKSYSFRQTVDNSGTYLLTVNDIQGNTITDTKVFYKTTLQANEGTVDPESIITLEGNSFAIPTPTRNGYTFNGWNTKADGTGTSYAAGANYKPTANVTLYAQWISNSSVLSAAAASAEPYYSQGSRDYLITVSNHPDKIQFILSSGSTKTFSKTQATVLDNDDGTENWIITASLKADDYMIKARVGGAWESATYAFSIVYDEKPAVTNGRIISVRPVSDDPYYEKAARPYEIKVQGKVDKIQFVNSSGTTITLSKTAAQIVNNTDGTQVWTASTSLKADTYIVKSKIGTAWIDSNYSYTVSYDERPTAEEALAFTVDVSGKTATFTVTTAANASKIQFVTDGGSTITFSAADYSVIGADGLRQWTIVRTVKASGTGSYVLKVKRASEWIATGKSVYIN